MPFFRKKPVIIEARRVNQHNGGMIAGWCGGEAFDVENAPAMTDYVIIETLEGKMRADVDDWVIKGVNGEFYPCKPDIFEKTYEQVGS